MTVQPPVWITPSSNLFTVTEGNSIAYQFQASDPNSLPLTYSFQDDTLPPGLNVSTTGLLSGTVGNIPNPGPVTYSFAIRITNGTYFTDRTFSITANAIEQLPYWDVSNLPDTSSPYNVYDFGTLQYGSIFAYSLGAIDPDGDQLIYSVTNPTNLLIPNVPQQYSILPPGLNLDTENGIIEGIIQTSSIGGIYYFGLSITSEFNSTPVIIDCSITIDPTVTSDIGSLIIINWITPAGYIGSIIETYPSTLDVKASASGNNSNNIQYSLATGSQPLPNGLNINPKTGDIEGNPDHIPNDTTYSIIVRARVGNTFLDRKFSFLIKTRYLTNDLMNVSFKMFGPERQEFTNFYFKNLPKDSIYRPLDKNYGIVQFPTVYMVNGLKDISDTDFFHVINDGSSTIPDFPKDYYTKHNVWIGSLSWATARDENQNAVYEVLYRPLIDPQLNAAGFTELTNTNPQSNVIPVENKVQYQNQPNFYNIDYVYPSSFRNMRLDLISNIGLNANPPNDKLPETTGVEGLPQWMLSRQIATNPNSVLGFIPCLVVGYVKVGTAQTIINNQKLANIDKFFQGHQITLDRFLVERNGIHATTFDAGMTYSWNFYITGISGMQSYIAGRSVVENLISVTINMIPQNLNIDYTLAGGTIVFNSLINDNDDIILNTMSTGIVTTFDGPPGTVVNTTFDGNTQKDGKYFKFPPGENKNGI